MEEFAGPIIQVNGFVFCENHGDEWCHKCCYDHRMTNNIQIEDDLQDINDSMAYDIDDRGSFNVYAYGAVSAENKKNKFQCREHDKIDCKTCFDWIGFIKQQAKDAAGQEKWLTKRRKYYEAVEG
ncbi:hypothetical protein BDN70DRAFT_820244 [Pholiota conissans]|uniref:Uncharacterized protein n=1 Tax=Pholiota conissans TaxID=109636 RepID=A0A9P6CT60_9AGAR|nr:hypothetical protein BDN70DRAFT_820244 [Pholiota conissans]